jgi:hypothetical protein
MPTETDRLNLIQPVVDDDIQDTIVWLSDNFKTIDDNFDEIISDISAFLTSGRFYDSGKKFWNRIPDVGGFAGWTNIRSGVFAPIWIQQNTYNAGDKITANPDNGHYYECITGGTSGISQPVLSTVVDATTNDLNGERVWTPSYNHVLNDIVVATVGDKSYYYKCIIAGTTGVTEPSWDNVSGSTIIDGSVHWYTYKTVVWKEKGSSCEFIQFGLVGEQTGVNAPITAVDIIVSGTWQATPIAVAFGGTGATTAKGARTNLGATTKYAVLVGDGASLTLVVVHNLATTDVVVTVREAITPAGIVNPEVAIIDQNTITVTFLSAPTVNQYKVIVVG